MAGRKQQDYTALPFFLTRTEWDKLLQSQDKWTRLGAVLQVASLLGLRSPSEPSMAVFFGLVHPNFREEDALSLNQSFCVFKDEVRQELLTLNADLSPPARLAQDRLRAPRHLPQELLTLVYSQGEMPLSELPIDKKQFYRKVSNLPLLTVECKHRQLGLPCTVGPPVCSRPAEAAPLGLLFLFPLALCQHWSLAQGALLLQSWRCQPWKLPAQALPWL